MKTIDNTVEKPNKSFPQMLKKVFSSEKIGLLVALVIIVVIFQILTDGLYFTKSNVININAALALNDLFEYGDDNIENFPNVVKNLNTRWLRIAFETAQFKLTDEDQNKFKSFIKSIDDQRQAA